jgi:hypothetical protein
MDIPHGSHLNDTNSTNVLCPMSVGLTMHYYRIVPTDRAGQVWPIHSSAWIGPYQVAAAKTLGRKVAGRLRRQGKQPARSSPTQRCVFAA